MRSHCAEWHSGFFILYKTLEVKMSLPAKQLKMSLPTNPLKMGQSIRNDDFRVLMSIKKQAL